MPTCKTYLNTGATTMPMISPRLNTVRNRCRGSQSSCTETQSCSEEEEELHFEGDILSCQIFRRSRRLVLINLMILRSPELKPPQSQRGGFYMPGAGLGVQSPCISCIRPRCWLYEGIRNLTNKQLWWPTFDEDNGYVMFWEATWPMVRLCKMQGNPG